MLTLHYCVAPFLSLLSFFFNEALSCCCPLGMINPEELNIEREEEIYRRLMRKKEENEKKKGLEDVIVFHRVSFICLHIKPCSPSFGPFVSELIVTLIRQRKVCVCVCV